MVRELIYILVGNALVMHGTYKLENYPWAVNDIRLIIIRCVF